MTIDAGLRAGARPRRVRVGLQRAARRAACGSRTCSARPGRRPGTNSSQMPDDAERAHRVQAPVPGVEVADDADRARGRRPDRERRAGHAVELAHVRAEPRVELLVAALAREVQVELADRRRERVGVAQRERVAVRIARPRARSRSGSDAPSIRPSNSPPGAPARARRPPPLDDARRPLGVRAVGADDDAAVVRVRAEERVRVGVLARDELRSTSDGAHDGDPPPRAGAAIPATGIRTQSGRLLSS